MHITESLITPDIIKLDATLEKDEIAVLFKKELKTSSQKTKMKGFRPGKTPPELVRKMYGSQLMVDVINKNLFDGIESYLGEHAIRTFANPVYGEAGSYKFNPDNIENFSISVMFALEPKAEVGDLEFSEELVYTLPELPEEQLEKSLMNLLKSQGVFEDSEEPVGGDSSVVIEAVELDGEQTREGGHVTTFTYLIDAVEDSDLRNALIGKKTGETVDFKLDQLTPNKYTQKSRILNLEEGREADGINETFRGTIQSIQSKIPAEMNEEFFQKIDSSGKIDNEEKLIEAIKTDYANSQRNTADVLFFVDFKKFLLSKMPMEADQDFFYKFFEQNMRLSRHALDYHLQDYIDNFIWSRAKQSFDAETGLTISDDEVKQDFIMELHRYFGGQTMPDSIYHRFLEDLYKKPEQVDQRKDSLYMKKLVAFMLANFNVEEKRISNEEFNARVDALNKEMEANHANAHVIGH